MIRETREMTRKNSELELLYKDECYAIIGACFEVYKDKGCGFHEPVYQECLTMEFGGHILSQKYYPDFLCYQKIVVELKAVTALTDEHRAQVLNYLKASKF